MAEKYPEGSPRPDFDSDLWTVASGGPKKGYVKGLGKRTRPSAFSTCSSGSSVGGSTATSAVPTTQASAEKLVTAIVGRDDLLDALGEAVIKNLSDERLAALLAQRAQASSQGSAHSEVILLSFSFI